MLEDLLLEGAQPNYADNIRAIAAHDCLFRYAGNEITVVTALDWFTA